MAHYVDLTDRAYARIASEGAYVTIQVIDSELDDMHEFRGVEFTGDPEDILGALEALITKVEQVGSVAPATPPTPLSDYQHIVTGYVEPTPVTKPYETGDL
jgi:hypothetical protein